MSGINNPDRIFYNFCHLYNKRKNVTEHEKSTTFIRNYNKLGKIKNPRKKFQCTPSANLREEYKPKKTAFPPDYLSTSVAA